MEPLDEKELSQLLRQWKAPDAPSSLEHRVMPRPVPSWKWLFTGTIRVPVPLGIAAVLIPALWIIFARPAPAPPEPPAPVSTFTTLADFQPVEQLEPTIVERNDESRKQKK
jgi:hypothetical protein